MTICAVTAWRSNAHMVRDGLVPLGYLRREWATLDPTYGNGRWWKLWVPSLLVVHDVRRDEVDFRDLPHGDATFEAVAFDPPFKLNGTPSINSDVDSQYGVHEPVGWRERHRLCREGAAECARVVVPGGYLVWKCQDQVCGGRVRWQTREFADHGESVGLRLVDRLDVLTGGRAQPPRTRKDGRPSVQQHARRNHSTALVFRKLKKARKA